MAALFSKHHVQNRGEQSLDATLTTASHPRQNGLTLAGTLRPLENPRNEDTICDLLERQEHHRSYEPARTKTSGLDFTALFWFSALIDSHAPGTAILADLIDLLRVGAVSVREHRKVVRGEPGLPIRNRARGSVRIGDELLAIRARDIGMLCKRLRRKPSACLARGCCADLQLQLQVDAYAASEQWSILASKSSCAVSRLAWVI